MRQTLYEYCLEHGKEYLLQEWDIAQNKPLTPGDVSYGSGKKVWWRCTRGHTWRSAVYVRSGSGTGCPYCAGKYVCPGENDLASRYPNLADQWHPAKNGTASADGVTVGSHKTVWWRCDKGHEWRAMVKSRVEGTGCPICANKQLLAGANDLATTNPGLARQWNQEKNGALTPRDVVAGARRKVWWRCDKGHEWRAAVASRARNGVGCPVCAGKVVVPGENDLASQAPDVAAQWHPTKNSPMTPEQITPNSNRKCWWRCDCGHEYQAAVSARVAQGSGCPYCAGRKVLTGFNDLATVQPEIAGQWDPSLNGALTPEMVTAGSHRKVWWRCPEGHVWKAAVYSRTGTQKYGCPVCAGKVKTDRKLYPDTAALVRRC